MPSSPSEPNYLDLFSGSNQGVTNDSCPHTFSTDNQAAELIGTGLTFGGYSEGLPALGSTVCTSGRYARKHNPWVNFTNVPAAGNMPFSSFPTDFTQLPTVSWVVPDLCNDMHDCAISVGDSWLQTNLSAYAQWATTHNSLLIVTFDEDDSLGTNNIATVFYGANVKTGVYGERIDHFSVLRTMEDMYGTPHAGAAATATPITDVWATSPNPTPTPAPTPTPTPTPTPSPGSTVTVTNPGNQTGVIGTPVSLQIQATDSRAGADPGLHRRRLARRSDDQSLDRADQRHADDARQLDRHRHRDRHHPRQRQRHVHLDDPQALACCAAR
jgi:phosphatidylinositol-3-phosphatase